eukprot:TRINITY_DN655_c0_g1_i1.p1 TRINITY_DN655_c0_g1~~TRINITY_DN655_c0_g1_i1.p1  ORF type:complete len:338 (-),score=40.48 TRINITY_DN655_c0_g1_i1:401-1384(-)
MDAIIGVAVAILAIMFGAIYLCFCPASSTNSENTSSAHTANERTTSVATSPPRIESGSSRLGVTVRAVVHLDERCNLIIAEGSIVNFTGDAIVNAANTGGLGGGGVDGAISVKGGRPLQLAREALPVLDGRGGMKSRIREGDAVTTVGGDLDAKWVIHAVGPAYSCETNWKKEDGLLRSAYTASIREALKHKCETVGFALLSAGIFRGGRTLEEVLRIGCEAVRDAVGGSCLREVYMVGFTRTEIETLASVAASMQAGATERQEDDEEDEEARAGARVKIQGLKGAVQHNGMQGVVTSFVTEKGRYAVKLDESGESLLVKRENMVLL